MAQQKETYQIEGKCFYCHRPPDYLVGVSLHTWERQCIVTGEACSEHVADAINNIAQKTFGTHFWPIVATMKGRLVYHSYQADQEGLSHVAGWEAWKQDNIK